MPFGGRRRPRSRGSRAPGLGSSGRPRASFASRGSASAWTRSSSRSRSRSCLRRPGRTVARAESRRGSPGGRCGRNALCRVRLRGNLVAPLEAAAAKHVASVRRAHAHPEAVRRAPVAVVGLVGPLHGSIQIGGNGRGYPSARSGVHPGASPPLPEYHAFRGHPGLRLRPDTRWVPWQVQAAGMDLP